MKKINLGDGFFAWLDLEDYERLHKYSWYLKSKSNSMYSVRFITRTKSVYMHHDILKSHPGMIIDHIDGNGLNNKKENLRIGTYQQNAQNARKTNKDTTSKYKGVHYRKPMKKWVARIGVNYKRISLGYYVLEKEAALAYNTKALELFGEYARINTIEE